MPERGRESDTSRRSFGHDAAALAACQHAVMSLAQLTQLGLGTRGVQHRASNGHLHRIYRAVYSLVPPELLTREGRWLAAVLACGPGAALSHRSAASLQELRRNNRPKIDVTVPGRSGRRHPGIDLHRSTTLQPQDVTTVRNIPCTSAARTLLDLAGAIDRRGLERTFDQAEVLGLFDLRALLDQLARNPSRPGTPVIRAILEEHYIGSTLTWSDLEELFLNMTRAAGLPDPEVNAWIDPGDGEPMIRADFVWRSQRLVVETDGHQFHRTRQSRERDSRNDQRLLAAGWRPIRMMWRQIEREGSRLGAMLTALLEL